LPEASSGLAGLSAGFDSGSGGALAVAEGAPGLVLRICDGFLVGAGGFGAMRPRLEIALSPVAAAFGASGAVLAADGADSLAAALPGLFPAAGADGRPEVAAETVDGADPVADGVPPAGAVSSGASIAGAKLAGVPARGFLAFAFSAAASAPFSAFTVADSSGGSARSVASLAATVVAAAAPLMPGSDADLTLSEAALRAGPDFSGPVGPDDFSGAGVSSPSG